MKETKSGAETNNELEQPATSPQGDFSTKKELKTTLHISTTTLTAYMNQGKIPYIKIGRRVIFHMPTVTAALLRLQKPVQ
jgi:hypothetical protein